MLPTSNEAKSEDTIYEGHIRGLFLLMLKAKHNVFPRVSPVDRPFILANMKRWYFTPPSVVLLRFLFIPQGVFVIFKEALLRFSFDTSESFLR